MGWRHLTYSGSRYRTPTTSLGTLGQGLTALSSKHFFLLSLEASPLQAEQPQLTAEAFQPLTLLMGCSDPTPAGPCPPWKERKNPKWNQEVKWGTEEDGARGCPVPGQGTAGANWKPGGSI